MHCLGVHVLLIHQVLSVILSYFSEIQSDKCHRGSFTIDTGTLPLHAAVNFFFFIKRWVEEETKVYTILVSYSFEKNEKGGGVIKSLNEFQDVCTTF